MKIEKFEDLEIWQESRELCKRVFEITSIEPFQSDFKFRDQIRSSSGSIMDNIAEGFERDGNKEFVQFLSISKGSCGEVRSQSYRAFDFQYIIQGTLDELISLTTQLSKKISSLMIYLKKSEFKGSKFKPRTSNLKPRTSNLKPLTSNLEPRTSNLKPRTSNLEPRTPNPEPRTPNPEPRTPPRTSNLEPRTSNPEPRTSNLEPRTSNLEPQTLTIY